MSGVQFAVWNKAMTEGVDSEIAEKTILKTANDGKIRIERLLPGVYCIQEVKGIAGYVMDNQIWEVTIDKDGKMQGKSSIEIIVENAKTEITETEAVSLDSNTHETIARENTVIQDTVRFKNLQVGEKVKIQGILMDKISGKPVLIQDKQVTAETEFMAAQGEQEAVNLFKFDASSLKGREVVVFEKAFIGDVEIAAHENLEEEKQAVRFLSPELRTTAKDKDTGKKKTEPKKETVIVDEVQYKNLIPGQKYRIRGILMERETGQELLIEGKTVTKEMTFLAEAAAGSVELEFAFDSSMLEGRSVVVFERIYIEETELAAHADITDKDQTIVIKEKEKILIAPPKKPEKEKLKKENIKEVKTGDTAQMGKFIIFSAGSLCAIGIMAQSLHKMKKRK